MKQTLSFILFVICLNVYLPANSQIHLYEKELNLLSRNLSGKMIELPGGDIVIQGVTDPNSIFGREFFCRIDHSGNIVWTRQLTDTASVPTYNSLMYLDSSGIIHSIGRTCTELDTNGNILVHKLIMSGVSAQRYGNGYVMIKNSPLPVISLIDSAYNSLGLSITLAINALPGYHFHNQGLNKTSDDGFIYYGIVNTGQPQNSECSFFIIKLSASLSFEWSKVYKSVNPVDSIFSVSDVIQTTAGDYIAAFSNESLLTKMFVLKLDSTGNVKWGKRMDVETLYSHVTEEPGTGNYLFQMNMPYSGANGFTVGVMKTDTAFNILSSTSYIDHVLNYSGDPFSELLPLSNGQFMLKTIHLNGAVQPYGIFLMKSDSSLNSCMGVPTSYPVSAFEMIQTTDTVNLLYGGDNYNAYPLSMAYDSNATMNTICQTTGMPVEIDDEPLNIFPNPSSGEITIYFPLIISKGALTISNMIGELVFEDTIEHLKTKKITLKNLKTGIYLMNVFDGKNSYFRKVIISHE